MTRANIITATLAGVMLFSLGYLVAELHKQDVAAPIQPQQDPFKSPTLLCGGKPGALVYVHRLPDQRLSYICSSAPLKGQSGLPAGDGASQ